MATKKKEFVVAFTGTSDRLTDSQKDIIDEAIQSLNPPKAFFSGAAEGVDTFAAAIAFDEFPKAKHYICIPYWTNNQGIRLPCQYDVEGVRKLAGRGALTVHCQPGDDPAHGYMIRNSYLAKMCTHMLAFPKEAKEIKRSGTWATVRRARKKGRKIKVVPLNR